MFAIHEIEMENQRSVFPRLFYFLAKQVSDACGRGGEGAVREAVRSFAAERGKKLRQAHRTAGLKQNVKSYQLASDTLVDTRRREKYLALNEEVCLKEVYTCPYAGIWLQYGGWEIGKWYCEEMEKARFEAYTNGAGQMHLSQMLTEERNNHCRFSMYYREANISPEEAKESFTENKHTPADTAEIDEHFYLSDGNICLMLYYKMYAAAVSHFGGTGHCAVAEGLKRFSDDAVATMRSQAKRTLHPFNAGFAGKNFPLPLELSALPEAFDASQTEANALLEKHMLSRIRRELDTSDMN